MPRHAETEFARRLGAEIRSRRLARGMSLRALAKQLHLSGHGSLVDYELGRRIPPENLVEGCERVFEITDGALRNLREKALAERANVEVERLLRPQEAAPEPEPVAPRWTTRRRVVAAGAVAALVAAGVGIGVWQGGGHGAPAESSTTPPRPVQFGFEDGTQRWSPLWGGKLLDAVATQVVAYEGKRSLQLVSTGLSNENKDKAIGVTHGLETLKPGMRVSLRLRVPAPQKASVRFFAYDSRSQVHWAPETPIGGEAALPEDGGWQRYDWTVPGVDVVHAIGVEIYQWTEEPVIIYVDAVSW
ncbi:helix-turn-helix domain-containing protein [Amycolatopsis sacchari]|uniref:HTH cro/C1-type domain-containing protein n=1 Tax=Amycolatopsis sacchari TaxID=115433 RepID=A0A1I3UPR0_9PSEU|nr:helix-turn-helix transcriptional regulator [Amycolatopsis sacchari]SFJ83996.1 hypothetical protein SAMN05421835_109133 [Amycolatopsis sacchari]